MRNSISATIHFLHFNHLMNSLFNIIWFPWGGCSVFSPPLALMRFETVPTFELAPFS